MNKTIVSVDCRHDHGVQQYLPGDSNPSFHKRQSETFTGLPSSSASNCNPSDYVTLTNNDVTSLPSNGPIISHYRGSSHSLIQPASNNTCTRIHQSFHSQSDLTFHCQKTPERKQSSTRSMQRSNQNIHAGVLTAGADTTLNDSSNNANFASDNYGQSPRHVAQNGSGVNIRLGLTSKQALERLFHEVNNELQLFSQQNGFNRS